MSINKYGSREWIDRQYAASKEDPWGLTWRPSQKFRYVRMFDALKAELHPHRPAYDIVDVGCATGAFTAMLHGLNVAPAEGSLVGVDIAEAAVTRAAARFPDIRFERLSLDQCADAYAGSADIVTCLEVLYYFPAAQRAHALRQLKRMLKPGGVLLVSSMIANPPYFSADELSALVASELRVVDSGVLYLKPIVLWEKMLMKLFGTGQRSAAPFDYAGVDRWSRISQWLHSGFSRSHAHVIARNDSVQ